MYIPSAEPSLYSKPCARKLEIILGSHAAKDHSSASHSVFLCSVEFLIAENSVRVWKIVL